jgi:methanogenic corrinoid protein MtbC1
MDRTDEQARLIAAIAELREDDALELVCERLAAGSDPLRIVEDCQEGMRLVGEAYERRQYYLSGLIMGGEILRQVTEMLRPVVNCQVSAGGSGKVLLGTVEGDIHDLGKNIVGMLLSCHSLTVYDLGVDVSPCEFARQALVVHPDVVGLSALLTQSYESMRQTVVELRAAGCQAPIVIGGGLIGAEVCKHVQADYWSTDAITGVQLCRRLVTQPD